MARPNANGTVTRELPPLSLRAMVRPGSVDVEKRTVEVVWSTGAPVLRGYFETWWEELSLEAAHVRLGRLNNGAPFLDTHDMYGGAGDVPGVVVKGSAKVDGKEGTATVRFAKAEDDPEADKIFRKIVDGILQNVSVGYRVWEYLEIPAGADEIAVFRAVDWEPFEISVVPAGADDGAGFRSVRNDQHGRNPCVFKERAMDPIPAPVAERVAQPTSPPSSNEDTTRAAEERAQQAERERGITIRTLVKKHALGDELAEQLVKDGKSVDAARAVVLDKLAERSEQVRTDQHVRIEGGNDLRRDSFRAGVTNALQHRIAPNRVKLEDAGREFRAMSLLRLAEEALEVAGQKTRGMAPMEIAGAALGLGLSGRQMSTSDFPIILADVANKTLRQAYEEAPATFKPIGRQVTFADFKTVKRNQLGEAPQLLKVIEGAEFTRGTIGEGREEYGLVTYGRRSAITRQTVVNDDLDAFSRIPMLFGRSSRDLESDLAWLQVTANAAMGDGTALFHANHGNLAGAGAVISIASLGAGRAAMRKQKGVDKKQFINVQAKYLVVPAAIETTADQFVSANLVANASASVNVFAGRLQVIAEPRLDADSLTAWYLAADPGQIDVLEYGYLAGEDGPVLESRIGFEVDGLEIKCRLDFAAKVIDHRGLYKNPGA